MMPPDSVSGSLWLLFLYDVSEEIRLDELRRILGLQQPLREPSFRHPAPEYVRFEKPPVVERASPILLEDGQKIEARINYYEYGVLSIALRTSFSCTWPELVNLANQWIASPELLNRMEKLLEQHLERALPALVDPYPAHLSEDYCIVHLRHADENEGPRVSATQLVSSHGSEIAQIVRGESLPLSEEERVEILQSRMSYYPDDLVVIGWTAAFIYDSVEGAAPTLQLLEYANSQLLDFRHYDELLTRVLKDVYQSLERERSFLFRWRLAHQAEQLNKIRLDIEELTERMDNSIKFLSDMFSARVYRLAAAKVGVLDYRRLVDEKLKTAADLYRFMMDQFHEARAFVMELLIIIILIIDLIFLFRGKS
jgi:hypothetical protein